MERMNILTARMLALLLAVLLLCGCAAKDSARDTIASEATDAPAPNGTDSVAPPPGGSASGQAGVFGNPNNGVTTQVSAMHADLSKRDKDGTWDDASAVHIALDDTTAFVDGQGAAYSNAVLTIDSAGTYVLSGTLAGSVCVDAGKDDKIQLVLNDAKVACDNGPALTILQADKVFLTVADGTSNVLSDAATYAKQDSDGEPDACIFSKEDLTINGAGNLTVTGSYGHGIVSKDELVVTDVQLVVAAADDGMKSNDGTTISGASLTITAAHDALETNGNCIIESGALRLNAGNDGIHADTGVYVNGGIIDIPSCEEGLEGLVVCLSGGDVTIVSADDGVNASGSKSTTDADKHDVIPGVIIAILDGRLSVTASGDGLDSNGDLLIAGGETYISIDMYTGNSALDYNGGCELTGGTLVAMGGPDQLQTVKSNNALPILCATTDGAQPASEAIALTNASGETLLTFTPVFVWQSAILRAPGMANGDTVILSAGNDPICTVTLDNAWTIYGSGSTMPGVSNVVQ